jgi:hypothetical protein
MTSQAGGKSKSCEVNLAHTGVCMSQFSKYAGTLASIGVFDTDAFGKLPPISSIEAKYLTTCLRTKLQT